FCPSQTKAGKYRRNRENIFLNGFIAETRPGLQRWNGDLFRETAFAEANVCRVKYEKSVSSIKLQSSLCTTGSAKVQGEFLCGWSIYFQKNTFIKLLFPNMELLTSP